MTQRFPKEQGPSESLGPPPGTADSHPAQEPPNHGQTGTASEEPPGKLEEASNRFETPLVTPGLFEEGFTSFLVAASLLVLLLSALLWKFAGDSLTFELYTGLIAGAWALVFALLDYRSSLSGIRTDFYPARQLKKDHPERRFCTAWVSRRRQSARLSLAFKVVGAGGVALGCFVFFGFQKETEDQLAGQKDALDSYRALLDERHKELKGLLLQPTPAEIESTLRSCRDKSILDKLAEYHAKGVNFTQDYPSKLTALCLVAEQAGSEHALPAFIYLHKRVGLPINGRSSDFHGVTPLFAACKFIEKEEIGTLTVFFDYLIQNGANPLPNFGPYDGMNYDRMRLVESYSDGYRSNAWKKVRDLAESDPSEPRPYYDKLKERLEEKTREWEAMWGGFAKLASSNVKDGKPKRGRLEKTRWEKLKIEGRALAEFRAVASPGNTWVGWGDIVRYRENWGDWPFDPNRATKR